MLARLPNYIGSFVFAALVSLVDWEAVRGNHFRDIVNYVNTIDTLRAYGHHYYDLGVTWFDYLKAEYLWFLLLYRISELDIDPVVALSCITFFCAFVFHRFVSRYLGSVWAFVFLLNPMVIQLLAEQVRSALAFSLFLITLMAIKRRWLIYVIYPAFLFIHSMMFVILMVFLVASRFAEFKRVSLSFKAIALMAFSVLFAIVISTALPTILNTIGDRRDLAEVRASSFQYMAFWLIWGCALAWSATKLAILPQNRPSDPSPPRPGVMAFDWLIFYTIFMCVATPIMVIFDFPAYRFMAISVPFVICTLAYLTPSLRLAFALALLGYQGLLFAYWIK